MKGFIRLRYAMLALVFSASALLGTTSQQHHSAVPGFTQYTLAGDSDPPIPTPHLSV
jgi:hypothetical protein